MDSTKIKPEGCTERSPFFEMEGDESSMAKGSTQVQDCLEKETQELGHHMANLRVQMLRNEEYLSSSGISSSAYTTEEDEDADLETKDCHLGEFEEPSEELCQKIVKQVESMFSDSFVYRDAFMMKHIRRGAGGFVSLRLVTSIRKVKSLTQDYRVVAQALRGSRELEVNEDGTKVRRVKPLPEYFNPALAQAILLKGMPREATLHEKVEEVVGLVSKVVRVKDQGDDPSALSGIPSVRIIKEAAHVPSGYHPDYVSLFDFDLGFCILLDFYGFEKLDIQEIRALLRTSELPEDTWKLRLEVHELPSIRADPTRRKNRRTKVPSTRGGIDFGSAHREMDKASSRSCFNPTRNTQSSLSASNRHLPNPNRLESPGGSSNRLNVYSPWSSPSSSPRVSPHVRRRGKAVPSPLATSLNSSGGESPAGSPWMARRAKAQSANLTTGSVDSSQSVLRRNLQTDIDVVAKNVGVLRTPRGPGEGKGFQLVRRLDVEGVSP